MKSINVPSRLAVLTTTLAIALGALGVIRIALAEEAAQPITAAIPSELATPTLARSEDENGPYNLWVGETKVTDDALSGKGWKFDKNSNTLSLEEYENTKMDGTEEIHVWHEGAAIYYTGEHELTIEAKGSNVAYGSFADESDEYETEIQDGYGILNDGEGDVKFVIRDGGSIEALGGKASLRGSFKVDKGLHVVAGTSINECTAVKGFDPTTEVKTYIDERSNYVYIAPKAIHRIVVADSDNGHVMAVPDIAVEGEQVELGVFPGMSEDGTFPSDYEYELDTLSVADEIGRAITVTDVDATSKTFTMPDSDVCVKATFKRKQHMITVASTTHGSASVDKVRAVKGEKVTLTISPDDGYVAGQPTFTALGVEDVPIVDNVFEMPGADVTVHVTFEKQSHRVKVSYAGDGTGTVSLSADFGAEGTQIKMTARPDAGSTFSGWRIIKGSGATLSDKNSLTTTLTVGVSDVEIQAAFDVIGVGTSEKTVTSPLTKSGGTTVSDNNSGSTSKLASTGDSTSLAVLIPVVLCGASAGVIGIRSSRHD